MKTQLKEHIFLIGFMGVGKTATSHALSKLSGAKEFDTDQMIVKQEHKSIPDIFAEEGEEYFRQRETEILTRLRDLEPGIISCGGGMVMRDVNVDKMKAVSYTHLDVYKRQEHGLIIPVLSVACEYIKPVLFGEKVQIHTRLVKFDGIKMQFVYEISVSYTHLDVYKRQPCMYLRVSFLLCGFWNGNG